MGNLLFITFLFFLAPFFSVNGFLYQHFYGDYFTSIHVLEVNPYEHTIIPIKAKGRESVLKLASHNGAVAAINGGFWEINGNPAGALKINHEWLGTPVKLRGAIGWSSNSNKVLIDRVLTNYSLSNCPSNSQIEVIPFSTDLEEWKECENIVGGAPVLIHNGNLVEDFTAEQILLSFLNNKYSRTAVGIKENGNWLFVVVDSWFNGIIGGMTIKELAMLMLHLGCMHALNLDGGGSSTMVIGNKIVNKKANKNVSDAILIFN